MDRSVAADLYAEALRPSPEGEAERLLDRFQERLASRGAEHMLLAGLPLPRRTFAKLIVRMHWPDRRNGALLLELTTQDGLFALCLRERRPVVITRGQRIPVGDGHGESVSPSELLAAAGGERARLVAVPVHDLSPWQGCVLLAGRDIDIGPAALAELQFYCVETIRRLMALGRIDVARPGDLSDRERDVLRLTATGKTAAEIADLLTISQRTVHAHLQNAGDKLVASNKTHTVIEALRYGQIEL